MMLVVAVALSTATYAWFTSSTIVTANQITMTAGTSQSTALGIQWEKGTSGTGFNANYTTAIDSVSPAEVAPAVMGFQPAAPVALDGINTAPVFKTAFVNSQGEFITPVNTTNVYRFANYADSAAATTASDTYSNIIHIANLAQAGADQTVYLTATITSGTDADDISNLVRIAVYELTTTTNDYDTYTYKGLLASAAGTNTAAVGDITGPVTVAQTTTPQLASSLLTGDPTTELNLGAIAPQADKAFAVYVWLDGALFDESKSSKTASISLSFSTVRTSGSAVAEINPAA